MTDTAGLLYRTLRQVVRILLRVDVCGLEHYPAGDARVLIVANHISLLDGIVLYLFLPVRPTFAINLDMARRWYVKPLLRLADAHELDTLNPVALKSLVRLVRDGHPTVIFPEGRISTTSTIMKVYDGPGMIADKADATIVPVAIEGLQYSRFSYLRGLHRLRSRAPVTLTVLPTAQTRARIPFSRRSPTLGCDRTVRPHHARDRVRQRLFSRVIIQRARACRARSWPKTGDSGG